MLKTVINSNKNMNSNIKRKHTPEFKFQLVMETLKNNTVPVVARRYGITPGLLSKWRQRLLTEGYQIFKTTPDRDQEIMKKQIFKLEQMLGKKEVELNLLKNFSDFYESQNTG